MTEPPAIYDCIEFAPAFRCGDVATENAFLVMDLRYRGAPGLAAAYVESYVAASGDIEQPALLAPLVAYRALVRAKVSALVAADPQVAATDREGGRHSSQQHLLLAAAVAVEARGPHWLLVCGPPASGKSRLCGQLATTGWPHFETDVVRKRLAGVPATERARPEHYSDEFSRRTYAEVLRQAAEATSRGERVALLDGNFPTVAHRDAARSAAAAAGARLTIVFVDVGAEVAAQRARDRENDSAGTVSDAGPGVTARLRKAYVPPTDAEGSPIVALDGARPLDDLPAELLAALLRAGVSP